MAVQPKTNPTILSPRDLFERWTTPSGPLVCMGTLNNWRSKGPDGKPKGGPPFVKIGHRVGYPLDRLKEWESKNFKNFDLESNDNGKTYES